MTTVEQFRSEDSPAGTRGVDVAGTVWPLFKLEALAVAVVVLLTLLIVSTLQVAVLGGAAAGTLVWVTGLVRQATHRQR